MKPAGTRPRTLSQRRINKAELEDGRKRYPEKNYWKPRNRSECRDGPRPCPFVSCQYHLYLDVDPVRGSIKFNFPHLSVHEIPETCALDVAERGGVTLEEVGKLLNLTRERVRQMGSRILQTLQSAMDRYR